MKNDVTAVSRTRMLMAPEDPVPDGAFGADWANGHWQAELRRITAGPPDTRPARRRRDALPRLRHRPRLQHATARPGRQHRAPWLGLPVLAGVTAGIVLIAAIVAGGSGGHRDPGTQTAGQPAMLRYTLAGVRSPVTATDLPPARAVLLHLAQVAAAQRPVPKPPGSDIGYTRVTQWRLGDLTITPHGPVIGPMTRASVQTWTAPDGAVMSAQCNADAGCDSSDYQSIPPNQRISMAAGPLASTLPTNPAALRARLLTQAVNQFREPDSQKLIDTIAHGLGEQVLTPQQQAGLWQVLAGQRDIRYMGTVRDRDGRLGDAVEYLGSVRIPTISSSSSSSTRTPDACSARK